MLGPWSLTTSRSFWEGFTSNRMPHGADGDHAVLRAVFLGELDWRRVQVTVEQDDATAILGNDQQLIPTTLDGAAGRDVTTHRDHSCAEQSLVMRYVLWTSGQDLTSAQRGQGAWCDLNPHQVPGVHLTYFTVDLHGQGVHRGEPVGRHRRLRW